MPDLSIFKLDSETITIKDTTARQAAESAKTLATTASGNATTALNKINELESEKADTIISSTSGAIASFSDGADDMPIKSLKVGIKPVQDLHGYENPWPAGGGVNICDFASEFTEGEVVSSHGITAKFSNGYLRVTGTNDTTTFNIVHKDMAVSLPAGTYIMPNNLNVRASVDGAANTNYASAITANESLDVRAFYVFAGPGATVDYNIPMMLVKGTTRPTEYTPYSNICPISGFDSVKVTRTGKNLLKLDESEMVATGWNRRFPISLKAGTYIISCQNQIGGSTKGCYVSLTDEGEATVVKALNSGYTFGDTSFVGIATTITEEEAARIRNIRFAFRAGGTTYEQIANGDIQLELGSTSTAYEPYQGETYEVEFPTEAGTVYGGELTIAEDGSGVLNVDWAIANVTATNDNGIRDGNQLIAVNAPGKKGGRTNFVSNLFKIAPSAYGMAGRDSTAVVEFSVPLEALNVTASDSAATRLAAFAEWLSNNPTQLCYELATPIAYTLSASQITTLLGQNNIWADTGDMSVTYRADTKLYIDNKFTELQSLILENLEGETDHD